MIFQGGFMVFHGFWLVSMVFQGGFMVCHGFWLVSMVFQPIGERKSSQPGQSARSLYKSVIAGYLIIGVMRGMRDDDIGKEIKKILGFSGISFKTKGGM